MAHVLTCLIAGINTRLIIFPGASDASLPNNVSTKTPNFSFPTLSASTPPPPVSRHLSQLMSTVPDQTIAAGIDDDRKLEELGYIPSFKREFSNLATVRPNFPQNKELIAPSPLTKSTETRSD
jgi:hypothetical protein